MLKPEQISNAQFTLVGKGAYRAEEVDAFLKSAADSYEQLTSQNADLMKKMSILAQKIEEYRAEEDTIKSTLLIAERTAKAVRQEAEDEKAATIAAAKAEQAEVIEDDRFVLKSQFRCNGSDEYIAWVESLLYNRPFEKSGEEVTYDIKLFDDLVEMQEAIRTKNNECEGPCRMLSGDVFPWISMKNKDAIDINIGDFHAQWNKSKAFAVDENSIDEVGCIHTAQGMEFDYAGLIVADDLIYRNGKVMTDYTKHPQGSGEFRRPHQKYPKPEDTVIIDMLIRNTYKVLFTRGQRGLYLYVMDNNLRDFIRQRLIQLKN